MANFVLEIGTEEMPARFFPQLTDFLADEFRQELLNAQLEHGDIATFSTPRRMVVWIENVADLQKLEEKEIFGPPANIAFDEKGQPKAAALGFAKSQSVDFKEIYRLATPKGEYLAVKKTFGGAAAADVLGRVSEQVVGRLPFPKKMKWEESGFYFGRPLRWLLALLGDKIVPIQLAGLRSGRETFGHRVLCDLPFAVSHADEYFTAVFEKSRVVVRGDERRSYICQKGNELSRTVGGRVLWNDALLEQVTNLVEIPVPLLGRFDDKFLELPREVLLTSMETHQKSFGLEDENGRILPYFLTVINLQTDDEELVRKGWQRVLRARLEDARFFWEADKKVPFVEWQKRLEQVVFLAPLGSMGDKSRRLAKLAGFLAMKIAPEMRSDLERAGHLAKADLVSDMVGEFDDLQGIMGGIYARLRGENLAVCEALSEQYLPAGQASPVPSSVAGAILALADKLDTLVGCFGLDMMPTGTADPYALRRQVLGVCRIILEHGFLLDLKEIFATAFAGYEDVKWKISQEKTLQNLLEFTFLRLKAFFAAQNFSTLVIDAALGADICNLVFLQARLAALAEFAENPDFDKAVLTFKRVDNIVRKQADLQLDGNFDAVLFVEDAEKELAEKMAATQKRWENLWEKSDFIALLQMLLEIRPAVDRFFDEVMVMCEDKRLQKNRLNLLQSLLNRLNKLANFAALQI